MQLKTFFAQDTSGNVLPGATVTVYQSDTLTLATGLQDEDGAPLSNPFNATAGGKVAFYAPDGLYDITVISGGASVTIKSQFEDLTNAATLGANTFTGAQTLPGNASGDLHAVPKQQLDSGLATKAALAGSNSQTFSVAAAASADHAVQLGQFAKTSSTISRPDGVSEKWGTVTVGDVTGIVSGSVTFPSAFPTACRNVMITTRSVTGQNPANFVVSVVDNPSAAGFSWVAQELSGAVTSGAGFFWRAIGD